jgi:hypothetical protein
MVGGASRAALAAAVLIIATVIQPTRSAWVYFDSPAVNATVNNDKPLNVTWQITEGDATFETIDIYLIREGTLSSVGRVAKRVDVQDLSLSLDAGWTSATEGRYYFAAVNGAGGSLTVVGAGPGPHNDFRNHAFNVEKWKCYAHSDCSGTEYCDADGACDVCSSCLYHLDPVDGQCPEKCGGDTLSLGDTNPASDEETAVGPVRNFVTPDCSRFNDLVVNDNEDITFLDDSEYARYMTQRLSEKLNLLEDLVSVAFAGNFSLVVRDGYQAPSVDSDPTTFNEGRSARVTLTPTPSESDIAQLSRLAINARFDWVFFEDSQFLRVSVLPDRCQTPLDLVFLLDGSGSIDLPQYGGAPVTSTTRFSALCETSLSTLTLVRMPLE